MVTINCFDFLSNSWTNLSYKKCLETSKEILYIGINSNHYFSQSLTLKLEQVEESDSSVDNLPFFTSNPFLQFFVSPFHVSRLLCHLFTALTLLFQSFATVVVFFIHHV